MDSLAFTAGPTAPPPMQEYSIEVPTKDRSGARYVFTVGDMIAGSVKDRNPLWALGGVIRDGALTLKYKNGYIRRCEITALRQYMDSDLSTMVEPGQRRHMPAAYVITEANAKTGELEQRTVGNDGLLRTPFYPIDEIGNLTGQSDGVVEMPCTTAEECRRAQQFLFPLWDGIVIGELPLPEKTAQLRNHFMKRLAEAQKAEAGTTSSFFSDVARAAIRSCDTFKSSGEELIRNQNARYDEAKVKGWAWSYGSDAEMIFAQLGIPRRDNLVQEQADKMDRLTDAMTLQAENQAKLIDLELARVQGRPSHVVEADMSPPVNPAPPEKQSEPPKPVDAGVREAVVTCIATTKSGDPCKNEALEDGFCKIEGHNAESEAAKAEVSTEVA